MILFQQNLLAQCQSCDKETFTRLTISDSVVRTIEQIRKAKAAGNDDEAARLKKRLPGLLFQCTMRESTSKNGIRGTWRKQTAAVLNGLYMCDFDHVENPRECYKTVIEPYMHGDKDILLVFITPSGQGLKIVAKAHTERGNLAQNQQWLSQQLGIKNDEACKDASRLSFCPRLDDILYIDDELFTYNNKEYDDAWGETYRNGHSQPVAHEEQEPKPAEPAPVHEPEPNALNYLGIPLQTYIDTYWQLFNNGQTPTQGGRDTLTFELCCNLRHICDFSRDVLIKAIPAYDDFPESDRLKVIDSALAYEHGPMPYRMRKVLEAVRQQHKDEPEVVSAFEEAAEQENHRVAAIVSRSLPFGVKDSIAGRADNMVMPQLTSLFPVIGAQATHVRLDIHQEGYKNLNLQAYIAGLSASNKGQMTELFHLWTRHMKEHDDKMRELEAEQDAQFSKNKNKTEQAERKHYPQFLQSLRTSMTEVLYRLQHAGGRHLLSYGSESDQLASGKGKAWSDMSVLLRKAYDGDSFEQDFKSEQSTRAWIDHVLWNTILCGTPDALFRMYRNYTNGDITRIIISQTPDNTYAPLVICKPRTQKAIENISQLTRLLPKMQGDITLPRLEKTCQQWLERVRVECAKNDDPTRARLRFRIAISVMRCIAGLMLCDFGGFLIREIDRKEQKPDWADGCKTAEEYLTRHPEATADWLPRKFQKRQTLALFDILADYYMDNVLFYFRDRIEKASSDKAFAPSTSRVVKGKNDDVFDRLPQRFTLKQAQQERNDHDYDRTRSMLKNWKRAGLIHIIDTATYEKLHE